MRPGFWGLAAAAAQHPLLNQVVMGMVAGGVRDIFIYICVPAAFRSPYSWWYGQKKRKRGGGKGKIPIRPGPRGNRRHQQLNMSNSSRARVAWCGIISHSFLISLLSFLFSRLDIYLFVLLYFLLSLFKRKSNAALVLSPSFVFFFFSFLLYSTRGWAALGQLFFTPQGKDIRSVSFLFLLVLSLSLFSSHAKTSFPDFI